MGTSACTYVGAFQGTLLGTLPGTLLGLFVGTVLGTLLVTFLNFLPSPLLSTLMGTCVDTLAAPACARSQDSSGDFPSAYPKYRNNELPTYLLWGQILAQLRTRMGMERLRLLSTCNFFRKTTKKNSSMIL